MHSFIRGVATLLLASSLVLGACTGDNDPLRLTASIEAFSGTPQVITRGEGVVLRWRAEDALVLDLYAYPGDAMPDDRQAWSCVRDQDDMVCRAPQIPSSSDGWDCDGETCRKSIEDDADGYRMIQLGPENNVMGNYSIWPDSTTTYRLTAEGNVGETATSWLQVVVTEERATRILNFYAYPTPALIGEEVVISYTTEGCDAVDEVSSIPTLTRSEMERSEGSNEVSGSYTWFEANDTRDFYLGCHPAGAVETARIRSHITVPVIQIPEVCERIDLFSVVPSAEVEPGTEIEVSWQVSNANRISGEADPEPEDGFYIGSTRFSGTWRGRIYETTTFTIQAPGECRVATASHTVTVVEPEPEPEE
jgi:hypothetical protein